tara:strand:- start:310 stop:708 length:399 start_codon:yes stop_codon:yes gene_type:complete
MNVDDFFKFSKQEYRKEMVLMRDKGVEYTVSNVDKLANFHSLGERMKCKSSFVAMIYLLKHMDSIRNYVLTGKEFCDESISGRIRDARNYLMLLHAIITEEEGWKEKVDKKPVGAGNKSSTSLKFTHLEKVD